MQTEVVQQLHKMNEKKVILMRKPHSPHEVVFTADVDPHFVNVEVRKRATGATVCSHYILKSDMPSWVTMYEGDGFKTITNNEDNERK